MSYMEINTIWIWYKKVFFFFTSILFQFPQCISCHTEFLCQRVYNGCVKIKFSNMLSFNFFLLTFQFSLSLLHDKFKSSVWKYYKPNMSRCVVDFPLLLCEGNFHSAELKIEMSWHVWTIKNQSPKSIKEFITHCDPQNKNPFYVWGAYKKI